MPRLSEKEKLGQIKWVLFCMNSRINDKGFNDCGRVHDECRPLCGVVRKEIAEFYHLADDLTEIC